MLATRSLTPFEYHLVTLAGFENNSTLLPLLSLLQALKKVPGVNASWHGDFIRQYHNIDISIAVQTPSGLMVPVVKDSDSKGLTELGAAVKQLAGKVRILLPFLLSSSLLLPAC